jgi:hypothetical protein
MSVVLGTLGNVTMVIVNFNSHAMLLRYINFPAIDR